jgi:hypothetical protein
MFSNGNRAPDVGMQARATLMSMSRRRFLAKAGGGGIGALAAPGLVRARSLIGEA